MALNPQERATTANQMMQILNNSGGGGVDSFKTLELTTTQTLLDFINASFTTINDSNFPSISDYYNDFCQGKYDKILLRIGDTAKYSFYLTQQETGPISNSFRFTGVALDQQSMVFMDIHGLSLFGTWTCNYFKRTL